MTRERAWGPVAGLLAATLLAGPGASQTQGARLVLPIDCTPGRSCEIQHYVDRDPGPAVLDFRCGTQSYDQHTGIDFRVPDLATMRRGVNVLAAAPGRVARTRDSVADRSLGQPLPADDPEACGNGVVIDHGGGWTTQYCHMKRGSISVKPGDTVRAGQPIGRVGLSGSTEFPHLHFTVRLGNQVVDPFAPDMRDPKSCRPQAPGLWLPTEAARMPYRVGAVLNAGWAGAEPGMTDVENGAVVPLGAASPVLIAYVRAIGLLPGDEVELVLRDPSGGVLAQSRGKPLVRWRAQDFVYVGKRRPAGGWPAGVYVAEYRVHRKGAVAVTRRLETRL